ncbi:LuxR family transcriptional regulator [Streptomyces albireticuli]|uniref:LuxR family transcriptional regulator n=1 Tax=Streptomyces albireticuli TaxID=1940 RepID=A0A1Z2LCU1_9ACTN|nr:response regulator transcription factor [Streptomyces albireticuli]ARZ72102.1 LuxR family transcriptional regulator [Streptomyces albireticuli]
MPRVLIVDDHPLFRDGLKAALESAGGAVVVAQAETGSEVPEAVAQHEPDIVVMDLSLPDISGIEATRRLARSHPGLPVLMLTMSDDDSSLLSALQAGARGYIVKGAGSEEVLHAVRTVAAGGAVLGSDIAARLTTLLTANPHHHTEHLFPTLTTREIEVLELIAQGLDNRHIARRLVLSEKTVRNHITHIFDKLHISNRAQAVAKARDAGLGSPERDA